MIFNKMLNMFKSVLGGAEATHEEIHKTRCILPIKDEFDIRLPMNRIISSHDKKLKNILIIDDSRGIVSIVEDMLKDIEKDYNIIELEDYNVITFFDRYAPFVLKETLQELEPIKIDYAIIDIMLPGKLKMDGEYVRMDGVDVAILLNEKYQCNNLLFYTGNTLAEYVDYISEKMDKFQQHFGRDMKEFIIFKGSNRPIIKNDSYDTEIETEIVDTVTEFKKLFTKEKFQIHG